MYCIVDVICASDAHFINHKDYVAHGCTRTSARLLGNSALCCPSINASGHMFCSAFNWFP